MDTVNSDVLSVTYQNWAGSLSRVTCEGPDSDTGAETKEGAVLDHGVLGLPDLTCLHRHQGQGSLLLLPDRDFQVQRAM